MRLKAISSMIVNAIVMRSRNLRQSADERVVEPVSARQPAADSLHRAALVVAIPPAVAGTRAYVVKLVIKIAEPANDCSAVRCFSSKTTCSVGLPLRMVILPMEAPWQYLLSTNY